MLQTVLPYVPTRRSVVSNVTFVDAKDPIARPASPVPSLCSPFSDHTSLVASRPAPRPPVAPPPSQKDTRPSLARRASSPFLSTLDAERMSMSPLRSTPRMAAAVLQPTNSSFDNPRLSVTFKKEHMTYRTYATPAKASVLPISGCTVLEDNSITARCEKPILRKVTYLRAFIVSPGRTLQ